MSAGIRDSTASHAVAAGVVTAVVGFSSSFAVVLTGLTAVGASQGQAASGLAVVSLTMGLGCIVLSLAHRTPVTIAWSTPGAALLAGAALPAAGWAGAVGAFVVAGLLYLLTAGVKPLGDWVARIPSAVASAMLAGVLLTLCVEPFRALAADPAAIAPVLVTWLVLLRIARRWAVPGALLAAVVVIAVVGEPLADGSLLPALTWTAPAFDWRTTVALGIPLYLVTMTGQNIPGVAVLESFGYRAPLRSALTWAGASTVLTAPAGGFSINLAAISAALAAGPEAGPDRDRRWIAGVTCGGSMSCWRPLGAGDKHQRPRARRHHRNGRRGRADRHLRRLRVRGPVGRAAPRGRRRDVPRRGLRPLLRRHQPGVLGAGRRRDRARGAPAPGPLTAWMVTMTDFSGLETAEQFHARVAAATDDEGRLAVAVEEMPGWDIFPFEIDSLRIKPLQPLADEEPPRRGEDPAECWCAEDAIPERIADNVLWSNDRWLVTLDTHNRLPLACNLLPREHCDLTSVPDHLSGEMGQLIVAISAAIEELPSVGRAQLAKYGDGGAHLHLFFFGRPDRMLQLRGSPLLDWEENLPAVPLDVVRANAAYVAALLIARLGGSGPAWA